MTTNNINRMHVQATHRPESRRLLIAFLGVVITLVGACSQSQRIDSADSWREAREYAGFGNYTRAVTTNSPEAQRWFNQGIQLLYGFNHDEAIRSFAMAAEIDPDCAMAWWGVGYAHGLHINNPEMTERQSRLGWEATREALRRADRASDVERALILALGERYEWPPPENRAPLDEAYAAAMERVWRDFPSDADVGALYAESLMNLQPWDLWTHEGEPKGRTLEIVAALERAMEINPYHPGANHFYIHAVEASLTPERAEAAADRLIDLVPGSGHLVHMPSHIYIRVGRYADAAESNVLAVEADRAYFALAPEPVFYGLYYVHNLHFLAYASMMEGRYETAIRAARDVEREVPPKFLKDYVFLADGLMPAAMHVMVRFGKWEDILREPEPPKFRLISRATRHYARGVALAATGRTKEARRELAAFDRVVSSVPDDWFVGNNEAHDALAAARAVCEGEILFHEGKRDAAFAMLRKGVELEEALTYDEPPGWMQPVRHALGALLIADGRHEEAERVFREDLARHPNNCWALLGLEQALTAQERVDAAELARVTKAREAAWKRADVRPEASCYCAVGAKKG